MSYLGRKERNDELDDTTFEGYLKYLTWKKQSVDEMVSLYDYESLTADEKVSFDVWKYQYEQDEAAKAFFFHRPRFTQRGGEHSELPTFLINFHQVDDLSDVQAYIARIEASSTLLNEQLEIARKVSALGITTPEFALEATIDQSRAVITGEPFQVGESVSDSSLWADMKQEVNKLVENSSITQVQADELLEGARRALVEDLQPAYEQVIAWAEAEKDRESAASPGLLSQPDGKAYYEFRLARQTTTTLSPKEIHQMGLDEVRRIRGEMQVLLGELEFDGDLEAFFVHLRNDPQNYFPNTDAGRQGYIDEATEAINTMKAQLPGYFGILPKADLVVRRVEAYRERDGAAQHYYAGSPDGNRPGIYYAHLSDMTAMPKSDLQTIAYHEGVPGHHMQISIAQERKDIPRFRTQAFFTAYTEGWALYSEHLATEIPGTYTNPYSRFGQLNNELWRAVRLVVDTGIHAEGWSEQEAIAYFSANSSSSDTTVVSEVRRYIVMPAQATTYKIGMMKILELRRRAESALGERFDIRRFHDLVLGGGALPLFVLERLVDDWITLESS
jgi:uncharacterized protein (DUF885 family)